MNIDTTKYLVIGAGATGWSVANYMRTKRNHFRIMDTRDIPPYANQLKQIMPAHDICFGRIDAQWIEESNVVVLSPGVSLQTPEIQHAKSHGTEIIGDVELFARLTNKPYVAITGSNGKSTVTTLVVDILNSQDMTAMAGANIGTPALNLLNEGNVDIFALELSSFQLETSTSLRPEAAVVLNISADHLDRHVSLEHYAEIKNSIYINAKRKIYLREEDGKIICDGISFGLDEPVENHYGIKYASGERWLMRGQQKILATKELSIGGATAELNVLAALALCHPFIKDEAAALNAIRGFKGLPHRCELVLEKNDVHWINDSKGTNIGATVAAISNFDQPQILILGGIHKGGSIEPLIEAVRQHVRQAIVFGRDKEIFINALKDVSTVLEVNELTDAVKLAANNIGRGEVVLFSPACASFDMFDDYQQRGDTFRQTVLNISGKERVN